MYIYTRFQKSRNLKIYIKYILFSRQKVSILDEKRTHIFHINFQIFNVFENGYIYMYKSSLTTYINHLQYINYFTTHNLQYVTYDTLLTTSCLQWNPTITILFTMETLTEYCITEPTLVASSPLIWICLKKFLGVPAKSDRILIKYLYCSISRERYLFRSFIRCFIFLKRKNTKFWFQQILLAFMNGLLTY